MLNDTVSLFRNANIKNSNAKVNEIDANSNEDDAIDECSGIMKKIFL